MKNIIIVALGVIFFSSCTKVVTIELADSDAKVVVESIISDQLQPYKVRLTLTAPYFNDSNPPIDNALVYISDDMGNIDTLTYNGDGFYLSNGNRQTQQGHTYFLKVIHNGTIYEAESRVPDYKMNVDSVSVIYQEASAFSEAGYNVILNGQENASTVDFVRFQFYKNDTLQTEPFKYFISDDIFVNGNYIIAQVPYNYQSGDTARVEIQSIDRGYYKFLFTLSTQAQNTGGPFDTAPANPPTNVNNGALGYFAACSIDWMEKVIP